MKKILLLSLLFSLISCNFNSTYSNRESDKEAAKKITDNFYWELLYGDNENEMLNLFSEKFYKVTNRDKLKELIVKSDEDFGSITEYNVKYWQTLIIKGTNPKSEYVLEYEVKRKIKNTTETFSLIKENDVIKIVGYNVNYNFVNE